MAITTAPAVEVKLAAAIMFKHKLCTEDQLWYRLAPATKAECKARLLQALAAETDNRVQKELGTAIAAVVAVHVTATMRTGTATQWPELLATLWQCTGSANAQMRVVALKILSGATASGVHGVSQDRLLAEVAKLVGTSV